MGNCLIVKDGGKNPFLTPTLLWENQNFDPITATQMPAFGATTLNITWSSYKYIALVYRNSTGGDNLRALATIATPVGTSVTFGGEVGEANWGYATQSVLWRTMSFGTNTISFTTSGVYGNIQAGTMNVPCFIYGLK